MTPDPTLPADWKTHDASDKGFKISAPSNWDIFLKGNAGSMADAPAAASGNPLENMAAGMLAASDEEARAEALAKAEKNWKEKRIALTLYDNNVKAILAEIPVSIVVTLNKTSGSLKEDADAYYKSWREQDRKSCNPVTIAAGPAYEVITDFTDMKGDVIHRVEYLVLHKKDLFRVTFRSTNGAGGIDGSARQIVETFRVTN